MVQGAGGAASGLGRAIVRNPKPAFHGSLFIVAFSFVAANALWYQPPGGHLSPFLATRDARDPNAIAGYRPLRQADPADVTTFRIERAPTASQQAQNSQNQQAQNQQAQNRQAQNQPSAGKPISAPAAQPATATPAAVPADDIRSIIAGQSGAGQSGAGQSGAGQPAAAAGTDAALVAGIQRALTGRGLYDGAADGLMGPRTEAAILFFEESSGLPQHGVPTPDLLAALQSRSSLSRDKLQANADANPLPVPMPRQAPRAEAQRNDARPAAVSARSAAVSARPMTVSARPSSQPATVQSAVQQVRAPARNEDPVTAAIRSSERQPAMMPPASIPGPTRVASLPVSAKGSDSALPSTMVLQIQKGLSNIAYTDVEVDGVAGSQTKAAIRRFQKHYRLPETGEPDQLVLSKLKAIGAL
jgi:peptidoglycan hydrolase-like protein with peptidoglycan-binding domain